MSPLPNAANSAATDAAMPSRIVRTTPANRAWPPGEPASSAPASISEPIPVALRSGSGTWSRNSRAGMTPSPASGSCPPSEAPAAASSSFQDGCSGAPRLRSCVASPRGIASTMGEEAMPPRSVKDPAAPGRSELPTSLVHSEESGIQTSGRSVTPATPLPDSSVATAAGSVARTRARTHRPSTSSLASLRRPAARMTAGAMSGAAATVSVRASSPEQPSPAAATA